MGPSRPAPQGPTFLGMPEPVGKYELRARLGQGAFGTVYLGYQRDLERAVAIKELLPRLAADPTYIERFRAEAAVMARLNSVHCVRVFDFLEVDRRALLVSEFVDGASLQAVIEQSGRLAPEQALGVLKGALSGLADANRDGLVHRDIKPANLLADRDGVSKLADFGQAYQVGGKDLSGGGVTGTPAYMSPEQVRGVAVDHRSDIYSCGAVLFELLAGRAPFLATSPTAVMRMHLEKAPPDLRRIERSLPPGIARLVQSAMAKDPAARPAGAEELLAQLEEQAVAGYGRDWESRASIRRLVEAAAVALGLLGLGAALVATTGAATLGGTSVGVTTVGGTTVGAGAGAGGASGSTAGGATGTGAAPASALRATSIGRRLATLPVAVAAGALVLLGAGAAALAHVGPFAPPAGTLPASLVAAFGPAALGATSANSGAASGAPTFIAGPDGSVVERVAFTSPADVPLGFAYCDAFVCGNSDNVDCIGNSYVPGFGSAVPLSVKLGAPPGARVGKVLVSGGPAPAADTALALFDPASPGGTRPALLAAAPSVGPGGDLALEFATPWRGAMAPHYNTQLARYCGFSPDQRNAFTARYGSNYHNPYPVITVLVRWAASSSLEGSRATVAYNGSSREVPITLAKAGARPSSAAVLLQSDPRWASTRQGTATYGSAGTVAIAVASVLSAVGPHVEPPAVGRDLVRAGAWNPSRGTDWTSLLSYLNQKADAAEIDLPTAATNAQSGRLALAALTDGAGGSARETLVVLTGYDPGHDIFTIIDPRVGEVHWSWDRLASANPWFTSVDRKATT